MRLFLHLVVRVTMLMSYPLELACESPPLPQKRFFLIAQILKTTAPAITKNSIIITTSISQFYFKFTTRTEKIFIYFYFLFSSNNCTRSFTSSYDNKTFSVENIFLFSWCYFFKRIKTSIQIIQINVDFPVFKTKIPYLKLYQQYRRCYRY